MLIVLLLQIIILSDVQFFKVLLNQLTAVSDILGGLKLISSKHPHLDIYINP